jgi:small ubiquitin-related modifier
MADASAGSDVKPDVKPAGTAVTIKLGAGENRTSFKVKTTTKFSKIANAYASKQGRTVEGLTFVFEGTRIAGTSDQTVGDLQIHDGDQVDVANAQVGGGLLR